MNCEAAEKLYAADMFSRLQSTKHMSSFHYVTDTEAIMMSLSGSFCVILEM